MFASVFEHSIIKRAGDKKLLKLEYINIRDFGIGKHRIVDDTPYGGGVGMVLRADVIEKALRKAQCKPINKNHDNLKCNERVILTDPRGETYTQQKARSYAGLDHLIIICGHYEAIDERVMELVDEKISIGDYVLTGGEIPAMILVDSIGRLIKGVLIKEDATSNESFSSPSYLEYPHYTKPRIWNGKKVPVELLSGNHKAIEEWKKKNATDTSSGITE